MVVNIEVADMMAGKNNNIEIQFGERVGHEGWLIGPKLPPSFASLFVKKS